ncbi:hypothetical protein [Brevundimonas sp. DC300-4]|uniref:hypothetical protein n=1 Tax=unclassified Brevundimonas TaxID=2622653 RepID=UPI003CF68CF8
MTDARLQLAKWFEDFWHGPLPANGNADLFEVCGIAGDDASDFMDAFGARFGVDDDGYRWYFHHGEEGSNFGGLFFKPPYRRVVRVPITPDMLAEAIESKRWPLRYPPHELPTVRWDIRINQILMIIPVIMFGLWVWKRFLA